MGGGGREVGKVCKVGQCWVGEGWGGVMVCGGGVSPTTFMGSKWACVGGGKRQVRREFWVGTERAMSSRQVSSVATFTRACRRARRARAGVMLCLLGPTNDEDNHNQHCIRSRAPAPTCW